MTAQDDTIRPGERLRSEPEPTPPALPLPGTTQTPATPVIAKQPIDPQTEPEQSQSGNSISEFVSENPGPSLLIGAGLAWLFVNRERSKSRALHHRLKDKASSARESSSERLSEARETTSERFQQAKQSTSERLSSAKETVKTNYHSVRQDNPLALGACALAVGLAIGLALPSTEREDELMGESRDSLMDQARRIVEEARSAAVATLRSGHEEVKEQARETVEESAREAKRAAQEEYRDGRETS